MSEFSLDTIDIISPEHYEKNGYPHPEWEFLRKHEPVFWYDRPNVQPFWAITKHADIMSIGRQPRLFLNAPRLLVVTTDQYGTEEGEAPFRHLLDMDPPDHGKYRDLVNRKFTPRAVKSLEPGIEDIARKVVDGAAAQVIDKISNLQECDFVTEVSAKVPLAVIAEMLGVPKEDWELLFKWTNETIGAADPEFQQGATTQETTERARLALFSYFNDMVEKRRKQPTEDITSVLANAQLDGQQLPPFELLSYFFLLVVAGNETTRNATTGGLLAFIENPDEWRKLRNDPSLLPKAVEEMVRWTTPVIQFARTAAEDTVIRGKKIAKGESMCLFFPSANRDEEVFEDPFRFRIDRYPNQHLAFGIGEHFCLGANLARLELMAVFRQLLSRLEHVEAAGPVERLRSSFVGGVKHMPIRYRMTSAKN